MYLYTTQKKKETWFCEPGNGALIVKAIFSTFGSRIIEDSNRPEETYLFIFLFLTTFDLVSFFSFLKETGCLPFLVGSKLTVPFHQIRVTRSMAVNTQRILSLDILSHGVVQCILGVFLNISETAGKHAFENLGIGTWWQKKYFLSVKIA